ncbi:hemerythrin domain-containing protein [Pleurocapsales cyanobacterium LEGE 06147]|nr:hemerythrin domain-containing protein [Pleurocapsales cyanobacterium LEGE 06147]
MVRVKGILSIIETDHRKVEELFEEFENNNDSAQIQEIFNQIYKELMLHARVEEVVLYPTLLEYEATQKYVKEAEKEHKWIKNLLEEIKVINPIDFEFDSKMQSLIESVIHHIEEEEGEIFEAVENCLSDEELQQLGQIFEDVKARLEPEVEVTIA